MDSYSSHLQSFECKWDIPLMRILSLDVWRLGIVIALKKGWWIERVFCLFVSVRKGKGEWYSLVLESKRKSELH